MMETYSIEDIIDDLTEPSEPMDISEESSAAEPSEPMDISEESSAAEPEESTEEELEESTEEELEESIEESQVSLLTDSSSYDDTALLSSLSVTNGLLTAILFVLIARWCLEKIESGVRRLLKDE